MNPLVKIIRFFVEGYEKFSVRERPKTFFKYFIYYPLNWSWTLGSLLFIGLLIKGAIKYEAPIFYYLTSIPSLMIAYNIIDEYNAFKFYATGERSVKAKILMYVFYGACALVLIGISVVLIINDIR